MAETTVVTEDTPDNGDTIVTVPVIIAPAPDVDPVPPTPTACEHTTTVVDLVERVTRLEVAPEPEPVVIVPEPEPEPEPVVDEEPDRGHPWYSPIGGE